MPKVEKLGFGDPFSAGGAVAPHVGPEPLPKKVRLSESALASLELGSASSEGT